MSIKEGYKQTAIGLIPEDWDISTLDSIFEIVAGTSKSKKIVDTGKYNLIDMGGIDKNGKIVAKKFINNPTDLLNINDLVMPKDDIGGGQIIGKVVIIEEDNKFILGDHVYKLKLLNSSNIAKYYYYLINSHYVNKIFKKKATGTAQLGINKKTVSEQILFIPPLEEQKKIAEILSTVDQKIAFVDNQIEETELLKKGLMQKLLTEGIGHSEFKDSELGRIPESWEVKKLGTLTSLTAGGTPSTKVNEYWAPKEIPWLSSGEVNKKIIFNTNNMISIKGLNNSATKLIPKNSILIALAGQGKTRGTVAITEIKLTTNQSVASIFPSEGLDMYFIYYNLDSRYEEIRAMSTGVGGRGGLNLAILKSIQIALPPLSEQKKIAEMLSATDEKLENLKAKKESFEELKKGLMQKLLTGEVRV